MSAKVAKRLGGDKGDGSTVSAETDITVPLSYISTRISFPPHCSFLLYTFSVSLFFQFLLDSISNEVIQYQQKRKETGSRQGDGSTVSAETDITVPLSHTQPHISEPYFLVSYFLHIVLFSYILFPLFLFFSFPA